MIHDWKAFSQAIDTRGYHLVESLLAAELVDELRSALELAIKLEAEYHGGTGHQDFGMVQCCPMYSSVFIEVFDHDEVVDPLEAILGEGCVTYSYSSSSQPPGQVNFSGRIHVDCPRVVPDYLTNFGVILLLDDFKEENGATWYLPGSQWDEVPPPEREFYSKAERLVAPAGSAWFFNPRLWHAGGQNTTDKWRHSLGINMCRSYMKQRFDIPRLLRDQDMSGVSERALQKLGFLTQTPTSLDEYYAPLGQRTFRQKYE